MPPQVARVRDPRPLPAGLGLPLAILAHLAVGGLHRLRGYRRPGTDPVAAVERAVAYDRRVVERWLGWLAAYVGRPVALDGLRVLELGPGPDLGAGLILLARGAAHYTAADAHDLATRADARFYDRLLGALTKEVGSGAQAELAGQLALWREGRPDRLDFAWRPDFDLTRLDRSDFDLVLSQAAFEHFDDPAQTFRQLARIVRPGARLVVQVDLKTHTPGLRDLDPLSIYRIPPWLYRRTRYPGVPNRVRPAAYAHALEVAGWQDVRVEALEVASERYLARTRARLARPFVGADSQIELLGIVLCATFRG